MKKQQVGLFALSTLILAGTFSSVIPLSAQETEKAEEQVGKYMEKQYLIEDRRDTNRVKVEKKTFYITDTFSVDVRIPISDFNKGKTHTYQLEIADTSTSPNRRFFTPEKPITGINFEEKFVDFHIEAPLDSFVYKNKDTGTTTNDLPPVRNRSNIVLWINTRNADGTIYREDSFGNYLGVWRATAVRKIYDQNRADDESDAVASVFNVLRMYKNYLDEDAYKTIVKHYKDAGKDAKSITASQVLRDGGMSLKTEYENIETNLTIEAISEHLKKNLLILNVAGKSDGEPVHIITADSVSGGRLQYTDPADKAFKLCSADVKDGKIRLEGADADDFRSFTITVVKNVDHWSVANLKAKEVQPDIADVLKKYTQKDLLIEDRRDTNRTKVGKPSFYITDTFTMNVRIPIDNFSKGMKHTYQLEIADASTSPNRRFFTPEKEITIHDFDDNYVVINIEAPLDSFVYKNKTDGTETNVLPPINRRSNIVLWINRRKSDGTIYREDSFGNYLGVWKFVEEKK